MWSGVPRSRKPALAAAALIIIIKIIKVNTGGHTQQDINIYTNIYSVISMQIYINIHTNIYSVISMQI